VIRPASVAPPGGNRAGGNRAGGANYGYAQTASAADHAIEQDSPPRELQQPATSLLPFAGLALAIAASILYVFPAGTPQPGDVLLAITIVMTILLADQTLPALPKLYISLGLFLAWVILVNSVWFILAGDYIFLRKTSFYIYNAAIMLFIVSIGMRDYERLRKVVYWSCVIALLGELIYLEFLYMAVKTRSLGTFNNPNQMGYWGLLMLACLGVARRREPLRVIDAAALAIGCYIIAQTLSRAATAAGLLMAVAVAVSGRWKRGAVLVIVGLAVLGGGAELLRGGVLVQVHEVGIVQGLQRRLALLSRNPDDPLSLWKRGYSRLVEHPEYLPLGAGEGAFDRLTDVSEAASFKKRVPTSSSVKEFHSSLGNILMSYGIVGLGLLFAFFFVVFRNTPTINLLYFGLIMLYGVTHMGMRDTMLWIFLGLVYVQGMAENSPPDEDVTPVR
jgi:hypothetical protein